MYKGTGNITDPASYVAPGAMTPPENSVPSLADTVVYCGTPPWTSFAGADNGSNFLVNTKYEWGGLEIINYLSGITSANIRSGSTANVGVVWSTLSLGSGGINIINSGTTNSYGVQFGNSNRFTVINLYSAQTWKSTFSSTGTQGAILSAVIFSNSLLNFNGKTLTLNMAVGSHELNMSAGLVSNKDNTSATTPFSVATKNGTSYLDPTITGVDLYTGALKIVSGTITVPAGQFKTSATSIKPNDTGYSYNGLGVTLSGADGNGIANTVPWAGFFWGGTGGDDYTDFTITTTGVNGATDCAFNNRIGLNTSTTAALKIVHWGTIAGVDKFIPDDPEDPTGPGKWERANLQINMANGVGGIDFMGDNKNLTGSVKLNGSNSDSATVGLGSNTALGVGTLIFGDGNNTRNSTLAAVGSDRTMQNSALKMATLKAVGTNTLKFTGDMTAAIVGQANDRMYITNNISGTGKQLIFGGDFKSLDGLNGDPSETSGTRIITFRGSGTTLLDGIISNAGTEANLTTAVNRAILADGAKYTVASGTPATDGGLTLILTGTNVYLGATTATNGASLYINGNNSGATGAVSTVLGTAPSGFVSTLGGKGTVGGVTTIATGTILSPGYLGAGLLTFKGNLTMQANTILRLTSPDVSAIVQGTLSLGATWTLELMPHANWLAGEATDKILVLGFTSGAGILPTTFTNNTGIAGIGTEFVVGEGLYLTGVMSAIPEPAAFALLVLGGFAIAALRRSRRKKIS